MKVQLKVSHSNFMLQLGNIVEVQFVGNAWAPFPSVLTVSKRPGYDHKRDYNKCRRSDTPRLKASMAFILIGTGGCAGTVVVGTFSPLVAKYSLISSSVHTSAALSGGWGTSGSSSSRISIRLIRRIKSSLAIQRYNRQEYVSLATWLQGGLFETV